MNERIEPHWIVAVVQTSREDYVQSLLLKRDGFESYLPRIRIAPKRTAALFPGYLMVRVVLRWYPIRWCPGVLKLLMAGEQPARLPDAAVAEIKSREVRGYVKLPKALTLERGVPVIVKSGAFVGHVAIYEGMSGPQRERVLLDLLGQSVSVEMPVGNVEPAQGTPTVASLSNRR